MNYLYTKYFIYYFIKDNNNNKGDTLEYIRSSIENFKVIEIKLLTMRVL